MARDYFEAARAAQTAIDSRLSVLRSMRAREGVRAQGYEALGHGSAPSDPMRATDARMDAEGGIEREIEAYRAEVAEAREVCRGIRVANPHNPMWGDSLELHYLELMKWDAVARALGVSQSLARRSADAGMDWLDHVGIASARSCCGQVPLF